MIENPTIAPSESSAINTRVRIRFSAIHPCLTSTVSIAAHSSAVAGIEPPESGPSIHRYVISSAIVPLPLPPSLANDKCDQCRITIIIRVNKVRIRPELIPVQRRRGKEYRLPGCDAGYHRAEVV